MTIGDYEKAEKIVEKIMAELNDREGYELDFLDAETKEEIRRAWVNIVIEEMKW